VLRLGATTALTVMTVLVTLGASRGAETVISEGAARDCFAAALYTRSSPQSIATCSDALDAGSLSREDRTATFVNRGILKERLSDFQGALSDYDQSLALRPDLAEAYLNRGAVLTKLARFHDALEDLNKAITLSTVSAHIAYYDRGQAREYSGDLTGACADYQKALALQPNYFPASQRLYVCRYQDKPKANRG